MSQGKVHKLSGISQKAVSNILAGDQVPSIDTADRLAKVFDRSASELMTETFMIEEEVDVSSKKLATIFMKLSHRDREEILRLADLLGQRDSEPS